MFGSFYEIEKYLICNKVNKRIVLCGSHDIIGLHALVRAKRQGLLSATLIGDREKTIAILDDMDEPAADYLILRHPHRHLAHGGRACDDR